METNSLEHCIIRRIEPGDAEYLTNFYNGLGHEVIKRFRPLGWTATTEACENVVAGNTAVPEYRFDLLALREGRIVGWCFMWDVHTENPFFGLGIAAEERGKGLGARLMVLVMQEARRRKLQRIYLTVVTDNQIAWRLYEKQGFVKYDEYIDEADGLPYFRMQKIQPARLEDTEKPF
ncbi:MAG: GNAT family N-acetyltransferase [bacterium]